MTHRNRALLDLCHEAPCFLLLGFEGCGRDASVPCHSDMIRHGRGKDHKSHDCFAVPGCPVCHDHFKRSELGPEGYHAAWTEAMERWTLYLWVSEKIRLTDINQRPKELSMEAPMCKICEHRHYVREPHNFGKQQSSGSNVPASSVSPAKSQPEPGKRGRQQRINCGRDSRRDGKNTEREGRRVLKAEAARPDATRTAATAKPNPPPATPGKPAGKKGQRRAAKPSPGKRKPRKQIKARKP